jgi:hypothetical protein
MRRTDSRQRADTVRCPSSQAMSIALLPNPTTMTRLPRSGSGESGFKYACECICRPSNRPG